MKSRGGPWILSAVLILQVLGLSTIFLGLVGVKKGSMNVTPIPRIIGPHNSSSLYKASVDKIVLIVIDAMRVDFLSNESMPHVAKLLDSRYGCLFHSNVKSPTVTLPRIKALVTGEISTYWDIIQNFHSKKIVRDNFIWHAIQDAKRKIAFYGDDTWLKLFPTEFIRSEGVSSFYVTDFSEVDISVTKHLDEELRNGADWDMLILHYLGVDHIGHIYGPTSSLLPSKLREMDSVVKRVYEYLASLGTRSILFVTGDHGMANVGGHGGNSYNEITTPLYILSTSEITSCRNQNWRNLTKVSKVEQVDIALTISALWGMIFPAESEGKVIWTLLQHLSEEDKLVIAYYNVLQLLKFSDISQKDYLDQQLAKIHFRHKRWLSEGGEVDEGDNILESYKDLSGQLSRFASEQLGEQNPTQMVIGFAVCIFSALISKFISAGVEATAALTSMSPPASVLNSGVLLSWMNCLIPALQFSSSFIEEEHYVRYYAFGTGILLLILASPQIRTFDETRAARVFAKTLFLLLLHRIGTAWNQTGQKWSHLQDLVDVLRARNILNLIVAMSVILVCFNRKHKVNIIYCVIMFVVLLFKTNPNALPQILRQNFLFKLLAFSSLYLVSTAQRNSLTPSILCTNVCIILTIFLQKHENIPLVIIVLVQMSTLKKLRQEFLPRFGIDILVLWLCNSAFFYQGNSNNIASIDVNAGYTGLNFYNEVIVGLQIFANTFSLPTLIILVYFESWHNSNIKAECGQPASFFSILNFTNSVTTCVFSLVILTFRHHLFVWSVFAPKLLYTIGFTIYYAIITLIYAFHYEITWKIS